MSLSKLISGLALKLLGWKVVGNLPQSPRNVVIGAPHTSMHDFVYGILAAIHIGLKVHLLVKKELFWFPLSSILRFFGGVPVDRASKDNKVDRIAAQIRDAERFNLAMSPEGTRRQVDKWKSGFYYIALAAKVPIVVVALDYGKKEVKICMTLEPSGDFNTDFAKIMSCFEGVVAKHPQKFKLLSVENSLN